MRRGWIGIGLLGGVIAGACVDLQPFQCSDDEDCLSGAIQGWCEDARFCSYPDEECPSGRRYSDLAGPLAGRCTGVGGGTGGSGPEPVTGSGPLPDTTTTGGGESSGSSGVVDDTSSIPVCGDGSVQAGEECDDANDQDGDGCNTDCLRGGAVQWEAVLASDGDGNDRLFGLTRLASGDVVSVGFMQMDSRDILLTLWSIEGEEIETTTYDVEGGSDEAEAVVQGGVGPLYVCGRASVGGSTRSWVGRWDASLTMEPDLGDPLPTSANGGCFDIAFVGSSNITAVGGTSTTAWAYRFDDGAIIGGEQATVMGANETRFKSAVRADGGALYVAGRVDDLATVYQPTSATNLGMPVLQTTDLVQPQSMAVNARGIVLGGLVEVNYTDLWVGAFELDGTERWVYADGESQADEVEDIALDPSGNVYAVGHVIRGNNNPDRWVAKLDTEGTLVWERHDYPGSELGDDRGRSIEVLVEDDVVVGLVVVAEITNAQGDLDGWIARLAP